MSTFLIEIFQHGMINGLFKLKKNQIKKIKLLESWKKENFLPLSLQKKRTSKTTARMKMMIPMTMEMATAVENPSSSILVLFPTSRKLTLQNYSQVWFTSIHNKIIYQSKIK